MKKVINGICVGLAFLALGLGVIGIVLPILPTTPFLLLAAALFAKGSERFHRWFMGTGLYKKYVGPAVKSKEMTAKNKAVTLITVTLLLTVGFIMSPVWYAKVILLVVLLGHYYFFLLRVKTVKETATAANSGAAEGEA